MIAGILFLVLIVIGFYVFLARIIVLLRFYYQKRKWDKLTDNDEFESKLLDALKKHLTKGVNIRNWGVVVQKGENQFRANWISDKKLTNWMWVKSIRLGKDENFPIAHNQTVVKFNDGEVQFDGGGHKAFQEMSNMLHIQLKGWGLKRFCAVIECENGNIYVKSFDIDSSAEGSYIPLLDFPENMLNAHKYLEYYPWG